MLKKIVIGMALLSLILIIVACAGPTAAPVPESSSAPAPAEPVTPEQAPAPAPKPEPVQPPPGPIEAKRIEPQVDGDSVSITVSEIESNWNTHFRLESQGREMNFMAYKLGGEIYVRANVCPPCRSIGFSLSEDILVCDRCATTFEAKTGAGIQGACVNYPKASLAYEIADGNILMDEADLIAAYEETLKAG